MHAIKRVALTLALVFAPAAGSFAADIVNGPTMGTAGRHTFTATPGTAGATITWAVDRITRAESNGGSEAIRKNVYTATGTTATFNLTKVDGKQTIWRIRATDTAGTDTQDRQVFIANRLSSFTFSSVDNPIVRTYLVVPSGLTEDSKMLFVMHGQSRNANDYCNYWRNWAIDRKILLVCPRFEDSKWPGGRGYNRGNVFADENNTRLNPESKWAFTVVEQIHVYARKGFKIDDPQFDIWGHSAGGQFVNRMLFHKPNAKVRLAMPANPGWYMVPSLTIAYPCGARHSLLGFTDAHMLAYTLQEAVLFSGTADTDPNDPETGGCMDAQGRGRYARSKYFYSAVKAVNPDTTWKHIDVPNVDHDGERMAEAAQDWLDDQ